MRLGAQPDGCFCGGCFRGALLHTSQGTEFLDFPYFAYRRGNRFAVGGRKTTFCLIVSVLWTLSTPRKELSSLTSYISPIGEETALRLGAQPDGCFYEGCFRGVLLHTSQGTELLDFLYFAYRRGNRFAVGGAKLRFA